MGWVWALKCFLTQNDVVFNKPRVCMALDLGHCCELWLSPFPSSRLLPFVKEMLLFNRSVVSDSLRLCGLQHARLPCPSPSLGVCSNSCPLSQWCHPTISTSVAPFFSCFQSFPASGSFQKSQLFTSGGQSTGVSASATVLPMNIQGWFPLRLTALSSLRPRDPQESSPTPQFKSINSSALSFLYGPTLTSIRDY